MAARDATAARAPAGDLPEPAATHGPAAGVHDCLHLDDATRQDAIRRLKTARGHLDGIVRMLEDPGVYCVDVLKQVKAVQGGLGGVTGAVLRAHVRDHVATASQRGDTEAIVDELMDALKYRT
jgi:DNA-binding FrmR family transcriptional regulator